MLDPFRRIVLPAGGRSGQYLRVGVAAEPFGVSRPRSGAGRRPVCGFGFGCGFGCGFGFGEPIGHIGLRVPADAGVVVREVVDVDELSHQYSTRGLPTEPQRSENTGATFNAVSHSSL